MTVATGPLRIGVLGAARIAELAIVKPAHVTGARLVTVAARDRRRAEAEGQRAVAAQAVRVHDEAVAECASLGIPADRETLWRLANRATWEAEHADLLAARAGVRRSPSTLCRAPAALGSARTERRSGPPRATA